MSAHISVFWFRRDLRLDDNHGLYRALTAGLPVLPVFIFDTAILDELEEKSDKRIHFIHDTLEQLQRHLEKMGSSLLVLHGTPVDCFTQLTERYPIAAAYTNHDYEPYAIRRDGEIAGILNERSIPLYTFKDQVIFEKSEVIKDTGSPYTVYTPYSRKWKQKVDDFCFKPYPTEKYFERFYKISLPGIPSLASLGFSEVPPGAGLPVLNEDIALQYHNTRDFPAVNGTTKLGVHLRFRTISIRKLAAAAMRLNAALLNELIWREFYQAILWHFPYVVNQSFKKQYDKIIWRNNEQEFERWCTGQTGYPIVDAGMRQLGSTGYMHNRLRMITASFLTKTLLIDWRWGEAWFAQKLLDYDLAANNGGWQWAAGCGCDAAPYFRIFNPALQTQKFDPELKYIRQWVPEIDQPTYVRPIIEHAVARERCLAAYKKALREEL